MKIPKQAETNSAPAEVVKNIKCVVEDNMKNLVLALLTAVLISSCTQTQSQNDFYGTWVFDDEGKMEYFITATIFTTTWTPELVSYVAPVEKDTFEIFSWEKITNENADTKDDYPTGYLLGLRHGRLGNTTSRLYMHRNKNSLISAYDGIHGYVQDVYVKPSLQSDFYGTWEDVDDNRINKVQITITNNSYRFSRWIEGDNKYDTTHDDILSWKTIINKDNATKNDYPSGYLIKYGTDSLNWSEPYYIHKNKKALFALSDFGRRYFYTKIR